MNAISDRTDTARSKPKSQEISVYFSFFTTIQNSLFWLLACVGALIETPLMRVLVILCSSVEEWWTQNKWKVQTTNTSIRSVSCAFPQVFPPLLNTYAQDRKRTIESGVLSVNPLGLITELQCEQKTDGHRTPTNNILIEKEINLIKKGKKFQVLMPEEAF